MKHVDERGEGVAELPQVGVVIFLEVLLRLHHGHGIDAPLGHACVEHLLYGNVHAVLVGNAFVPANGAHVAEDVLVVQVSPLRALAVVAAGGVGSRDVDEVHPLAQFLQRLAVCQVGVGVEQEQFVLLGEGGEVDALEQRHVGEHQQAALVVLFGVEGVRAVVNPQVQLARCLGSGGQRHEAHVETLLARGGVDAVHLFNAAQHVVGVALVAQFVGFEDYAHLQGCCLLWGGWLCSLVVAAGRQSECCQPAEQASSTARQVKSGDVHDVRFVSPAPQCRQREGDMGERRLFLANGEARPCGYCS